MLPWNLSLTSNSLKDERSNIEYAVTKKYFKIDYDIIQTGCRDAVDCKFKDRQTPKPVVEQ